ncbi:competence protein ComFC [Cytobacillus eiseniae]|uniref:Competence protein ComFC n=1 Tax=Cytobacillus eiseniae TaxID=762947 RepID=A0ABS4RGF2_9BACI|nr:ComF family protein [Cytobacillus eiseniae]MBP2241974.1 competence protein ComFC [Cytobacillus eiseniae]
MSHCQICMTDMMPQIGWRALFLKEDPFSICRECASKFEEIKGETCRSCDRSLENVAPQFKVDDQCADCIRWETDAEWAGVLDRNYSLLTYNTFAKEVLARYKFRGDYAIAFAFVPFIKQRLQSIPFDALVPIPLSEERLYERGFNQSEALIIASGYKPTNLLTRIHSEKQSKKSRAERIHLPQVFQTEASLSNEKVLLIDDIYTTGSTLRHAAKLLKSAGAQSVCSLTLARG